MATAAQQFEPSDRLLSLAEILKIEDPRAAITYGEALLHFVLQNLNPGEELDAAIRSREVELNNCRAVRRALEVAADLRYDRRRVWDYDVATARGWIEFAILRLGVRLPPKLSRRVLTG